MRVQQRLRDVVVMMVVLGASAVWAGELQVTKLRTEKIGLYDCKDGTKKADFARKDFQGSWPVLQDQSVVASSGLLPVSVGGQPYCVKAYTVETNKPMAVSAECGAMVAAAQPKSAATRGLGEECQKR
jgi:hypothetical protein